MERRLIVALTNPPTDRKTAKGNKGVFGLTFCATDATVSELRVGLSFFFFSLYFFFFFFGRCAPLPPRVTATPRHPRRVRIACSSRCASSRECASLYFASSFMTTCLLVSRSCAETLFVFLFFLSFFLSTCLENPWKSAKFVFECAY